MVTDGHYSPNTFACWVDWGCSNLFQSPDTKENPPIYDWERPLQEANGLCSHSYGAQRQLLILTRGDPPNQLLGVNTLQILLFQWV